MDFHLATSNNLYKVLLFKHYLSSDVRERERERDREMSDNAVEGDTRHMTLITTATNSSIRNSSSVQNAKK